MAASLMKRRLPRRIIILLKVSLTPALLGYSPSEDSRATSSTDRLKLVFGERIDECPDSSRLDGIMLPRPDTPPLTCKRAAPPIASP